MRPVVTCRIRSQANPAVMIGVNVKIAPVEIGSVSFSASNMRTK